MKLQKSVSLHLTVSIEEILLVTCTGVVYLNSTPLRVYRQQRVIIHRMFNELAELSKCSIGWIYGFTLHLIIPPRDRA
ncbi:transposase [Bacteroides acidifaciens]|uniref:transposase n=1 Tax=Bacteroides acidifaciens TaxID=85831 RepID=UPI0033A77C92